MRVVLEAIVLPSTPAAGLSSASVSAGSYIQPIERIKTWSSDVWEEFTHEWVDSKRPSEYSRVMRSSGPGDMGIDIAAFVYESAEDPWDCYQCKHYDHPLRSGDAWVELGKVAYHTFVGDYTLPRRYRFAAPQGVGPQLSSLLRSPDRLRAGLRSHWSSSCENAIASTPVPLTSALDAHIGAMDFRIFGLVTPVQMIREHASTQWHAWRFGGGLADRGPEQTPPDAPQAQEARYVRALLDAYEDKLSATLAGVEDLTDARLRGHFDRARREFYCAESLREFSQDNVPPGAFDQLLEEVHAGVIDTAEMTYPDGFDRVLAVVKQSKLLDLTANALHTRTYMSDRGGMCHQLANVERLKWRG